MSTLKFMKQVLVANRTTGAIAPSGPALAEKITAMADVENADVIVEYGPGDGVFTEVIERKRKPTAHFIALEVNPDFVKATQKRCPGVAVYHDGAQNAAKYLKEAGHDGCDVIVSGLPWSRFDEALQDEILQATYDVLRPGGRFVTFAYFTSPHWPTGKRFFRGKLPEKFNRVTCTRHVWSNFPPCVVFIADKD